jgi:protein-S-isoprenylcysteine O-methyltransferase Ste14
MQSSATGVANREPVNVGKLAFSMTWRLLLFLGSLVGMIGVAAGRWDLWNVWGYAGVYMMGMVVGTIVVARTDPTLFQERLRPGPGGKDPYLRVLAVILMLGHIVVAGLDVGRLHWSGPVPAAVEILGLVVLAGAFATSIWAMSANRFFSSDARIQRDRGHTVVTGGPYRLIRHPGYLAAILISLASPLALGSYVSALPMVLVAILILRRLLLEERMLLAGLEGYVDYAAAVRYRLLPGIW